MVPQEAVLHLSVCLAGGPGCGGLASGGGAPVRLLGMELSGSETQKSDRLEILQDLESIESAGHSFWVAVYLQVAVVTQEC